VKLPYTLNIVALIGLTSCSAESPTITFVFPKGYYGLVLIAKDVHGGEELKRVDNKYTVQIPTSGKVFVKSYAPFDNWHKEVAKYVDGTSIPDQSAQFNELTAFSPLRSVQGSGIFYFLGTRLDRDEISKRDLRKMPLATKRLLFKDPAGGEPE
jgi:hypothetical protein